MRNSRSVVPNLLDALGERRVVGEIVETVAALGFQQLLRGVGDDSCGVVVACVDAQRSAVRGNFLDVEDAEAVGREDAARSGEREVREVLVVDRVELVLFDESREVRELHRDHTVGLQQQLDAGDEVVEVGDLGQHVVPDHQVGPDAVARRAGSRARR